MYVRIKLANVNTACTNRLKYLILDLMSKVRKFRLPLHRSASDLYFHCIPPRARNTWQSEEERVTGGTRLTNHMDHLNQSYVKVTRYAPTSLCSSSSTRIQFEPCQHGDYSVLSPSYGQILCELTEKWILLKCCHRAIYHTS